MPGTFSVFGLLVATARRAIMTKSALFTYSLVRFAPFDTLGVGELGVLERFMAAWSQDVPRVESP